MKKINSLIGKICMACLLVIININITNAQKSITLNQAIDEALKNNLSVKNQQLKIIYQQKINKTAASISQANLLNEAGQFNSIYYDTKLGITQSFNFPTVYIQQQKIVQEELKAASTSLAAKEIELSKNVKQIFYSILILQQKQKLLLQTDSIYVEFLKKSNLRLKTGESNGLENASAESMQGTIHLQLNGINQEIEIALLKLQLLLNTTDVVMPYAESLILKLNTTNDSSAFQNHPSLQLFFHQKKIAAGNTRIEKAKLLPEISIGYFNTSIKGTGADNGFYTSSNRFHSIQFGVGIPLFFNAQRYRIKAACIQQQMANNNFKNYFNDLKNEWNTAWIRYYNNLQNIEYYEKKANPNANLMATTAQLQFNNGMINYLEWVMIMNQSIAIQNNYLESLQSLNESIITIQYLTSK